MGKSGKVCEICKLLSTSDVSWALKVFLYYFIVKYFIRKFIGKWTDRVKKPFNTLFELTSQKVFYCDINESLVFHCHKFGCWKSWKIMSWEIEKQNYLKYCLVEIYMIPRPLPPRARPQKKKNYFFDGVS